MLVRRVQVPGVVRVVLPEPLDGAALDVEGEHRVGVEVLALPEVGVPRRRVADTEEGQLRPRIVRAGEPHGAAAVFPRFAWPRIDTGLAGGRDGVGSPQLTTAVGVEGGDESTTAHLAGAAGADDDLAVGGERRHREEVTVLVVGQRLLPDHGAGLAVERDHARVHGAEVDAVPVERGAAVHRQDLDQAGEVFRKLRLVLPEDLAGRGVHRVDAIELLPERRRHDHHAVVHERRRLLVAGLAQREHPPRRQALDVLYIDLGERAVAPAAVAPVVGEPVLRLLVRVGQSLVRHVGPLGRRWRRRQK